MRPSEICCPICKSAEDSPCVGTDNYALRYYHGERITDAVRLPPMSTPVKASDAEWDRVLGRVVDEQL